MMRKVKSYFSGLRASARLGRAFGLSRKDRKEEAIIVAREALAILARPHVKRANPIEASVLISATVLVEELAQEMGLQGAHMTDITDALAQLQTLENESDMQGWIPFLERCLNLAKTSQAAGNTP